MGSPRLALAVLLLSVTALALPAGAGAAGLQTYVSGTGDDADDCTLLTPCKTWAGAISRTTAGGTMSALDSAGFGTVTITKSVTIDGAGHLASSLAAASIQGMTVNGAGINVVIKRLNIDGTGICTPAATPHGIRFLQGSSLTVQDVSVQGFRGAGISLEPSDGHGTVLIRNSVITNNCTAGVRASSPALSGDMTVRLEDNLLTGNATGVRAGAHSAVTLTANTIVANTTPTATEADGTLTSLGDNRISGVSGTLGSMPAAPVPAPGPSPGPGAAPAPTPTPVVLPPVSTKPPTRCKVPKLTGVTLASAKKALKRAHCKLGTVSYRTKKGAKRNRVYRQSHKAGSLRVAGAKVAVSVNGRAPRKAKHKARTAAVIGPLTRAWVTAGGDDVNPCSRTAPCRTFARAVTLTAQNGIVNVIGDGNYGPVTIDHSLTIDGLGATAAISVASGNAITVAAGAGEKVIPSGTSGPSTTTPCTSPGAVDGILQQSGGPLLIDNVTAHGFPGAGIALAPSADGTATIRGGSLTDNCTAGLSAQRPGGALTAVADGVLISDNAVGIAAGDGSLIHLTGSDVSDNATGFAAAGSGQIQAWPANTLGPNTTPGFTPGTLPLS